MFTTIGCNTQSQGRLSPSRFFGIPEQGFPSAGGRHWQSLQRTVASESRGQAHDNCSLNCGISALLLMGTLSGDIGGGGGAPLYARPCCCTQGARLLTSWQCKGYHQERQRFCCLSTRKAPPIHQPQATSLVPCHSGRLYLSANMPSGISPWAWAIC